MKQSKIGEVSELWQYPVKSMAGQAIQQAKIDKIGMQGDRVWAVHDDAANEIISAKRFAKLMLCSARYQTSPSDSNRQPVVDISLPDGTVASSNDDHLPALLSALLGHPVSLSSLQADKDYYLKRLNLGPASARQQLGMLPSGQTANLGVFPLSDLQMLSTYATPPGTHYDVYPLHILSQASLNYLAQQNDGKAVSSQRFRPSLLVDTGIQRSELFEQNWQGGQLTIGSTVIDIIMPTIRCSMPAQAQAEFPQDANIAKIIRTKAKQFVGAYARVIQTGEIKLGDAVIYQPTSNSSIAKAKAKLGQAFRGQLIRGSSYLAEKKYAKQQDLRSTENIAIKQQGFSPYHISLKQRVSDDIVNLYLKPSTPLRPYLPGQHLVLRINNSVRCYSISGSDPELGYRISVKREGSASTQLHKQMNQGDQLLAKGPLGNYYLLPQSKPKNLVLIAMGIGITPMLAIVQSLVSQQYPWQVQVVYGRANGDAGFDTELQQSLSKLANSSLHLVSSQPKAEETLGQDYQQQGRITANFIDSVVSETQGLFYLCGNTNFMQNISQGLLSQGVDSNNIKTEYFKSQPMSAEQNQKPAVQVLFKNSDVRIQWQAQQGSLLDVAQQQGIDASYGCRYGACEACQVNILQGSVSYQDSDIKAAANKALLCCAIPNEDLVLEL